MHLTGQQDMELLTVLQHAKPRNQDLHMGGVLVSIVAEPLSCIAPGQRCIGSENRTGDMWVKVTEDIEELRLNTAISAMMEFVNGAYKWEAVPKSVLLPFVLLLSPFAPHLAEDLWRVRSCASRTSKTRGQAESIANWHR